MVIRLIFLLLLLCSSLVSAGTASYSVHWVGEQRKMVQTGDDRGVIELASLKGSGHLYALGPVEGRDGEITVLDGDPLITTIRAGRPQLEHSWSLKAAFLVYANVPTWRLAGTVPVASLQELESVLLAKAQGHKTPFPFRLSGRCRSISMHVLDRRGRPALGHHQHDVIKATFNYQDTEVELLGFWSDQHHGVFTHMDSNLHLHGRTADGSMAGHVDEVEFESAKLWLPGDY
jgi:acetolactate decarboxylase